MSKIYVGDVGTIFDLDVDPNGANGTDLTGYTVVMEFKRPSGATFQKTAALAPGSVHIIRYTIVPGDLDTAGTWYVQAIVSSGGNTWSGETATFNVYAAFT